MKKALLIFVVFLFCIIKLFATHQRAAEIIYKHLDGLTYEVWIITYANNNPANESRTYLPIEWGDGDGEDIPRTIKQIIENGVVYNEYYGKHTFPGPGTYTLSMEDPNRNWGVVNIPNSVNVPIYVETTLVINPLIGANNSVQLLNEPIDYGCVNKTFIHNPGAYDADGDSLSYRLVKCRGAFGEIIPGYVYPNEVLPDPENTFTINPLTGDMIWDVPNLQGEFNIAFIIEEWRRGVKVGSVVRDMQIKIDACDENPPVIEPIPDTCIEAGETLSFEVNAYSIDGDIVEITATGGPFEFTTNPAYIDPDPGSGDSLAITTFIWETTCNHVRKSPYQVYFKAIDYGFPISLVDYLTMRITVIAPEPENLMAEPLGNRIILNWDESICPQAIGYNIYRRNGYYGFIPGYCETGVPGYTGYKLIKEVEGIDNTTFEDDNNGQGLIHGINYCYMVTAYFNDGAESYASLEACAALIRDLPVITNVSNDSSNNLNGDVLLAWSRPTELDTIANPGPYVYEIFRTEGLSGNPFQQIATNFGLNDTLYTDTDVDLNTSGFPYRYRVDLVSTSIGEIGPSAPASSMFLKVFETDEENRLSLDFSVPWSNTVYEIYREDEGSTEFNLVGTSINSMFNDTGLINGKEYCYYVKSTGSYSTPGIIDPIINFSQKACGIPYDNVPPCPPVLSVFPDCEDVSNTLIWSNPNDTCDKDIDKYLIYFSPPPDINLVLIDSVLDYRDTTYYHENIPTVVGCYAVKAVDSVGNISEFSNIVCVDTLCGGYRLPNAFTPNGDEWNQYFMAYPESVGAVQRIDMVILNRWGNKVYETTDQFFKWDGINKFNNKECPEGVYFYICDVYEFTFDGIAQRTLKGSVTIIR